MGCASIKGVERAARKSTRVVKNGSLTRADFTGSIAGPKGDQGPKGDKGDPGPVGQIQGAAAGGDLSGTYPDPAIAPGAGDGASSITADGRPIRIGDLLVASSIPGRAMRAPANPAAGTVIGKALQSFDQARGSIKMLVMAR